ncbi:WxL protein host-binding domain-containing protein [Xylocopilactobacillus apis]|uniref:Cell surface protein n=1 Tax=Xylocopilactobacillus apis TaxID=2932183 RepID=A0AAU9D4S7_9LACO|nr:DUF3324 domain-containing protein [Xylocopilactobacillus apis]BDR57290.1 cell surface protein [Xylocopilactobacillus apis]
MTKIKKFITALAFFLIVIGIKTEYPLAVPTTGADFIVTPNHDLTPNSDSNRKNNLWINVKSVDQPLVFNIDNKSSDAREFLITANTAYTGIDGQIHYDLAVPRLDRTLVYNFRYFVQNNDQRVKVPAKTKKSFRLNLKIPDTESYHGQVLGAITVIELTKQDQTNNKGKTNIVNHFSIGFPVALNFGGSEIPVNSAETPFKIGTIQPGFGLRGGLAILTELRNTKPAQILDFNLDGKITAKGKNKVLFRSKQNLLAMAPNSIYNYQLYWTTKDGFKAGHYHLSLAIKVPGNPAKTYHLGKDFTVTPSQAEKFNRKIGIKPNYLWLYIIIAIIVLLLLLLLTFLISRHQRNKSLREK